MTVSTFPHFILLMICRGENEKAKEYNNCSDADISKMAFLLEMLKNYKKMTENASLYVATYWEALKFIPDKSIEKPADWEDFTFFNFNLDQMSETGTDFSNVAQSVQGVIKLFIGIRFIHSCLGGKSIHTETKV